VNYNARQTESAMDTHKEIEDQAAAFLAQRDSGDWTDCHQAQLEQWLAQSTARRVGFLRLEAVWDEARRLKALSAGLAPGVVPAPGEWRHTPFFDSKPALPAGEASTAPSLSLSTTLARKKPAGRTLKFAAIAANVMLAIGIVTYFTWNPSGDRYSTPIGGIASVPLQDGSNITLNTATEVHVALTPEERHIRLDDGEAFFEVAHDAKRPFVVQAGDKRVIAVGTKFSVRRNGDEIRVVVTEGKVRVESRSAEAVVPPNSPATALDSQGAVGAVGGVSRDGGSGEVFLTPGSVASAGDAGIVVEQKPIAEVEDDLTWRQGYLTFHDISLADAIAEFNRYNVHKISIQDPTVAAIRISGSFRASNSAAFVRVLGDGFAIHAASAGGTTTLTR
jgi:transmembrane sensor